MKLKNNVRFITAASLFDGHDAAINIMRRILQAEGAEVIHLGHNRAVHEIVKAAIEEDVQGIAVSSYQGGHIEYFSYMLELLKKENASSIKIFGGGGGVIVKEEISLLEKLGIAKIFSPEDGLELGLLGMIQYMLKECDHPTALATKSLITDTSSQKIIAQTITTLELGLAPDLTKEINDCFEHKKRAPIIGITGTGGAGKSSLIDEILLRFVEHFPKERVAVLSVDPTKVKTGGALLGDRIRLNNASNKNIFVRSLATRQSNMSIASSVKEILQYLSLCHFDLVILETAGIGQSDNSVKGLCDFSMYVMTPEYGAASQLEKIAMLDYADLVAINKFDKAGSLDALREVRKAYLRNHQLFNKQPEEMPVFDTSAHIFGDLGTNRLFNHLMTMLKKPSHLAEGRAATKSLIPKKSMHYLSQIADLVREHHQHVEKQANLRSRIDALINAAQELKDQTTILKKADELQTLLDKELNNSVDSFIAQRKSYEEPESAYQVRTKEIKVKNYHESLAKLAIPKVSAPKINNKAELIRFVGKENLPGFFPFTAGVFPFKRSEEDPTRMFAGEGSPERTNQRFHYLSHGHKATRLSTAFDSVTLYGENPDLRPDIYGKVGNAGVSVCSLDDAKRLYSGFDLSSPNTSVSMTINGPAPTMLAFFFNAAIDFECEKELKKQGLWQDTQKKIEQWFKENNLSQPKYRSDLPEGHSGMGLGFLGIPASKIVDNGFYNNIKDYVLKNVRGTIQADILKEDQAQNTCIFSTEFSLRMMGDVQKYFIDHAINNFYSVSVSGYHIAEAGANPISQLAFTLANGFTLLEYYKARGMKVDDFAKNFSFFFSNGVDPEYAVIGRVARRIWAIALKKLYQANDRSQKLKYHIQTSGRSLHAQEMAFNDIRTTLQALYAIADNCNSLHTNAYDEAITTPTKESVRRAVAIQLIINHELGLSKNENPWQGSYFIEYLTDQVEEAVLKVFDELDERGGVLGAMETMYQRSIIQEESLYYEQKKHSGKLQIIGVNTFVDKECKDNKKPALLMRSTTKEKDMQVEEIKEINKRFVKEQARSLQELKTSALKDENTFAALMEAAKYCSLGDISKAFFAVGGAYRRAM